jgi:hypothetical protein
MLSPDLPNCRAFLAPSVGWCSPMPARGSINSALELPDFRLQASAANGCFYFLFRRNLEFWPGKCHYGMVAVEVAGLNSAGKILQATL